MHRRPAAWKAINDVAVCYGLAPITPRATQHLGGIMNILAAEEQREKPRFAGAGRNDPCPCEATAADGTAVKFKKCHGK